MQLNVRDKRGSVRSRILKGGVIAFSGRHVTMPCVVRDISDNGARLQVANVANVPDSFELLVELDGLEAACTVAWRKGNEVGVSFAAPPLRGVPKRVQVLGSSTQTARLSVRRQGMAPVPAPVATVSQQTSPEPEAIPTAADVAPANIEMRLPTATASKAVIPILIAEDDPDDRLLLEDAFAESSFSHPIDFVQNGVELLQYVRGQAPFEGRPRPGLILLDLNMPKMDGRTALMHLKTDSSFKRIPVIVLTTSNAEDDIQRTYDLGVTAYMSKPGTHSGLMELVGALENFWMRFVNLPAA